MLEMDFKDQTVIITGATRGIGKAIADLFSEYGARLILTGTKQDVVDELNQNRINENIKYYSVNFNERNSVDRFFSELEKYPRLDVCINNAGINIIDDFVDTKEADFDQLINTNLKGPYLLCRYVSKRMKEKNYGRIINIASIWSEITRPKRSLYTTTKNALYGLTKTIAIELAQFNVIVNSVSPGFTLTELTQLTNTTEEIEQISKMIPIKRMADPAEIARVVIFLSSKMNTYIVGQNIIVDGGYTNV
ncbi:MAG: SDR family NAD(P)-dependent oxidoreductase [Ignavibacteriales bacterium]|nr:SDR family NAD(P)-dependent oxidoreductase [Ignavibacteriales bacterium]